MFPRRDFFFPQFFYREDLYSGLDFGASCAHFVNQLTLLITPFIFRVLHGPRNHGAIWPDTKYKKTNFRRQGGARAQNENWRFGILVFFSF